jgi:hypothetical protein
MMGAAWGDRLPGLAVTDEVEVGGVVSLRGSTIKFLGRTGFRCSFHLHTPHFRSGPIGSQALLLDDLRLREPPLAVKNPYALLRR